VASSVKNFVDRNPLPSGRGGGQALNKLALAQSKNVAYYNCGWDSDIVAPPRYLG
jgi:hypothetical protein